MKDYLGDQVDSIPTPKQESIYFPTPGYVYFAKKGKYIKIGRTTKTPKERIDQINDQNHPEPVLLINSIKSRCCRILEKVFHEEFKDKRVQGK